MRRIRPRARIRPVPLPRPLADSIPWLVAAGLAAAAIAGSDGLRQWLFDVLP